MACSVASIAFSQFLHRAMQFRCDRADFDLVCVARRIIARRANNESNFFWTRQTSALRPRAKSAMQCAQGQRGEKAERVEMAGMICYDNERSIGPKIFMSDNFEPMIDAQASADDHCDQLAHSVNQHVGVARKSAQAINQWLVEIARGIVMPGFHRNR